MKQFPIKQALYVMALAIVSVGLSSFSVKNGGEGFEIFINNKVVLQQFGNNMKNVRTIQLDQRFSGSELGVRYHHCGQTGKNRSIAIKDENDKILKEWKYANVSASSLANSDASMTCKVKDILSLEKSNPGKLGLYYTSEEIPKGKLLAYIIVADLAKAK